MNRGNREKTSRRNMRKNRKSVLLMASFIFLFVMTIGGTVAFIVDQTDPLTNIFNRSTVAVEIEETLEGQTKSEVKIQNIGDTDAYIRAAVIITWQDENGNVYGKHPVEDTDYTIQFNLDKQTNPSGEWILGEDGFYYWTDSVLEKAMTGILIESCLPIDESNPEGYFLNVEILASAIQSNPTNAVVNAWSSGVSGVDSSTGELQIRQ